MFAARDIWHSINRPNLIENILPTRPRATLVLRKDYLALNATLESANIVTGEALSELQLGMALANTFDSST